MRDPDKLQVLAAKMDKPRERYLKWKQVLERYDVGKHAKLAQIIQRMGEKSAEARKQAALASEEWSNYLEEMDSAGKEKVKAQVEFENLKAAFEALQSALSYDRESMKHNIHGGQT